MGKPDVDEVEIAAGAKAIGHHYGDVIGEGQARNISYVVLCAARGAKSDFEKRQDFQKLNEPGRFIRSLADRA